MTTPTPSPDEVRRLRLLLTHPDGVWRAHAEEAAEALAALAARVAEARVDGMRKAAGIAEARADALCDFGKHVRAGGAEEAAKDIRAKVAAILAAAEKQP